MMNGQQPSYDGATPVTITLQLTLASCQQLMTILTEATVPWKIVNPFVVAIDKQVQAVLEKTPELGAQRSEGVLPPGMNRG